MLPINPPYFRADVGTPRGVVVTVGTGDLSTHRRAHGEAAKQSARVAWRSALSIKSEAKLRHVVLFSRRVVEIRVEHAHFRDTVDGSIIALRGTSHGFGRGCVTDAD